MTDERTRTYTWEDPFALRDAMAGRSGLELMQLMAAGELPPPPIAQTLGFRLVEAERGHARLRVRARPSTTTTRSASSTPGSR